jgi:hypothetical protein
MCIWGLALAPARYSKNTVDADVSQSTDITRLGDGAVAEVVTIPGVGTPCGRIEELRKRRLNPNTHLLHNCAEVPRKQTHGQLKGTCNKIRYRHKSCSRFRHLCEFPPGRTGVVAGRSPRVWNCYLVEFVPLGRKTGLLVRSGPGLSHQNNVIVQSKRLNGHGRHLPSSRKLILG